MVDDHVLNRDQHQEDHRADDVVSADHEASERFDHVSRGRRAGIAVQQNQPRGGNVQSQAVQRQQQQRGGKNAEIDRPADVHRHHHHDDGQHDVDDDQEIQQQAPACGVISAMTIATTAIGTPISLQPNRYCERLGEGLHRDCGCLLAMNIWLSRRLYAAHVSRALILYTRVVRGMPEQTRRLGLVAAALRSAS